MQDHRYRLLPSIPSVDDYQRLREVAGLTPFPRASAEKGLPGSVLGVRVECDGEVVGMGRVVGDGALFFQVTDIAVDPRHQGRGLGKAIVKELMRLLGARVQSRAYVSLMADGAADALYRQYGFEPVAPKSQGMARWLDPAGR